MPAAASARYASAPRTTLTRLANLEDNLQAPGGRAAWTHKLQGVQEQ